jgi:hypothetical protein
MANLYSVIKAFNQGGDGGAILVAVVMGIGAPLIALFTGKMFVDIHRADRVQDVKSKRAYREACIAWDKEIERAYKAHLKASKRTEHPVQLDEFGRQRGYVSHATEVVTKHLSDNPQDSTLSARKLAEKLNVSKSTVNSVQQQIKSANGHRNGHGDHGHSEI